MQRDNEVQVGVERHDIRGVGDFLWGVVNFSDRGGKRRVFSLFPGQYLFCFSFSVYGFMGNQTLLRDVVDDVKTGNFDSPLAYVSLLCGLLLIAVLLRIVYVSDRVLSRKILQFREWLQSDVNAEGVQNDLPQWVTHITPIFVFQFLPHVGTVFVSIFYLFICSVVAYVFLAIIGVINLAVNIIIILSMLVCTFLSLFVMSKSAVEVVVDVEQRGVMWRQGGWLRRSHNLVSWSEISGWYVLQGVNEDGERYAFYIVCAGEKLLIWGSAGQMGRVVTKAQEQLVDMMKTYSRLPLVDVTEEVGRVFLGKFGKEQW